QCPYCGNPTIIPGQFSIGLKPNYIIPFTHTPEQAQAALKKHYKGKFFLDQFWLETDGVVDKRLDGIGDAIMKELDDFFNGNDNQ
ncbi:MAG: hypothetical protein HUK26_06665, partial [Duodenibacillus sp.]|nr:hypothetical protein [Duodenibacillus sp.]